MKSKVLLFDFDGTIADSFENFLEIVQKLSIKHKLPTLSRDELEKLRSEDAKAVVKSLKIPFYKIPFLASDMKKLQQQQIKHIKPFKNLTIVLHKIKKLGYSLGILTSNGEENVKTFLKSNDMDIFDYIYSDSSLFGKDKTLLNFLKQNSINKKDVFYIGDEIRDINASKKVGIKIISVSWGFNTKQGLEKSNPDFLVNNPDELLKLLSNNGN